MPIDTDLYDRYNVIINNGMLVVELYEIINEVPKFEPFGIKQQMKEEIYQRRNMKKVKFLIVLLGTLLCVSGCGNRDLIDTVYTYDTAIIALQNGEVIEGKVQNWRDYEGDVIQVKVKNKTYYVHSSNVTLIAK